MALMRLCYMSPDSRTSAAVRDVLVNGLAQSTAAENNGMAASNVSRGVARVREIYELARAAVGISENSAYPEPHAIPDGRWQLVQIIGGMAYGSCFVCLYVNNETGQKLLRAEDSAGKQAKFRRVERDSHNQISTAVIEIEPRLVSDAELESFMATAFGEERFSRSRAIAGRALSALKHWGDS